VVINKKDVDQRTSPEIGITLLPVNSAYITVFYRKFKRQKCDENDFLLVSGN